MKKAILIIAALMLVVSGVAAVSAYEAHTVNVKAHVENALTVDTAEIDFGTVFPEEWLSDKFLVSLSDSAMAEIAADRLLSVDFEIFAEWKLWDPNADPLPPAPIPAVMDGNDTYYQWMGYFTYVAIEPAQVTANDMILIGPPDNPSPPGAQATGLTGHLNDASSLMVYVAIDTPVFEGYYNALTDMLQADGTYKPKPSGLDDPTWIVPANFPDFDQDGMDFGLDIKVQVTNITRP